MLDNFRFYVEYGMNHVLDVNAYDHILFLIVLTVPYLFNNWKRVLLLVTLFTIGHTLSLLLAVYDIVKINGQLVEFGILLTILIVAIYQVFTAGKTNKKNKLTILLIATLCFGIIHGLGFAREFNILFNAADKKLIPLLEFALGIEIAQAIVVFVVLFAGLIAQTAFRFSKRDWVLVVSSIVIGVLIPLLLNTDTV